MAIAAAQSMENNRGGSGRGYTPMRRMAPKKDSKTPVYQKDLRMRFKNSKDPAYIAFEFLDNQPISRLAADFVKDSFFEIVEFMNNVTSVMK